jgi:hypothetical protein
MDDRVFGRMYSLVIGRFEKLVPKVKDNLFENMVNKIAYNIPESIAAPGATASNGYFDFVTIPASFIEITDLQMTCRVTSNKDSASPAIVKIWNLHPDDVKKIKQDDLLILKAGYRQDVSQIETSVGEGTVQDLPLILVAQVVKVKTTKEKEEVVTEIVCGDSITVKKNVKVTASWPPGTTRLRVIQDLVKMAAANGIPTGNIQTKNLLPDGKTIGTLNSAYLGGCSIHGYLFDELEKLAESSGMRAYTTLGKLYVEPKTITRTIEVIRITPAHIKGNVNPEADNTAELSGENEANKVGLTLNLFLNGRVVPGQVLILITSVDHDLNFREDPWDTIVSCVKL